MGLKTLQGTDTIVDKEKKDGSYQQDYEMKLEMEPSVIRDAMLRFRWG